MLLQSKKSAAAAAAGTLYLPPPHHLPLYIYTLAAGERGRGSRCKPATADAHRQAAGARSTRLPPAPFLAFPMPSRSSPQVCELRTPPPSPPPPSQPLPIPPLSPRPARPGPVRPTGPAGPHATRRAPPVYTHQHQPSRQSVTERGREIGVPGTRAEENRPGPTRSGPAGPPAVPLTRFNPYSHPHPSVSVSERGVERHAELSSAPATSTGQARPVRARPGPTRPARRPRCSACISLSASISHPPCRETARKRGRASSAAPGALGRETPPRPSPAQTTCLAGPPAHKHLFTRKSGTRNRILTNPFFGFEQS